MTFPVLIPLGRLRLHPHTVFDVLAYSVGFRLFLIQRRRLGDTIDTRARWTVVAAAILGAAIGSKLLFWLEDPAETLAHWNDPFFLLGGKTIVGGLIGGLIGVEIEKRWAGLTRRTGDLFAMPLAAGIAIGRLGCFLSGLPDRTDGIASSLPWAIDFGDGIPRHPPQLYESIVMAFAAIVLGRLTRRPHREGDVFKLFMTVYFGLRVAVDALKPDVRIFLGLSSLQWASVAVLLYYGDDVRRWVTDGWNSTLDSLGMAYALKMNGKVVPLTGLIDPQILINGGRNTIVYEQDEAVKKGILKLFATNQSPRSSAASLRDLLCCLPHVNAPALGYQNLFRIIIMQFIDAYSFDVRSVKKTCVHIVHPDGRLIPFDTYNLFYRDDLEVTRLARLRGAQ